MILETTDCMMWRLEKPPDPLALANLILQIAGLLYDDDDDDNDDVGDGDDDDDDVETGEAP